MLGGGIGVRVQNDVKLVGEVNLEMDDAGVADLNSSNNKDKDILDVQVHMVDAGVGIDEENAGQVVELHHH